MIVQPEPAASSVIQIKTYVSSPGDEEFFIKLYKNYQSIQRFLWVSNIIKPEPAASSVIIINVIDSSPGEREVNTIVLGQYDFKVNVNWPKRFDPIKHHT